MKDTLTCDSLESAHNYRLREVLPYINGRSHIYNFKFSSSLS